MTFSVRSSPPTPISWPERPSSLPRSRSSMPFEATGSPGRARDALRRHAAVARARDRRGDARPSRISSRRWLEARELLELPARAGGSVAGPRGLAAAIEDCLRTRHREEARRDRPDRAVRGLAFDLRERAAFTGDFSLQWVIKIVQRRRHAAAAHCSSTPKPGTSATRSTRPTRARKRRSDLLKRSGTGVTPLPRERRLRVFAFDPSWASQLETAGINEVTLAVPWERTTRADILQPGPVGEYVEVVDHDPGERRASTSRST